MGRPARIHRDEVLAAGLALADEGGIDAVTMSAVAARVGVSPMALYHHVTSKADLLDGLVELLLADIPGPAPGVSWQERLETSADHLRSTARRHPAVFPLLLARPATTAGARASRRVVYEALHEAGVPSHRVAQVERLVSTAVLGFALSEAAGRFRTHSRRQLDEDFAVLQRVLEGYIESEATTTPALRDGGNR